MDIEQQKELAFASCNERRVKARFDAGDVSSDAGLLLLREADRRLGLTRSAARAVSDTRQAGKVRHDAETLVRQRVFGLASGYEDLNDFDRLRDDPLVQTANGRSGRLAGSSTLCRFENRQGRSAAVALNRLLVDSFMDSFKRPPRRIILDFDATDDPVHGTQEGRFFHGYYGHYCFLPLYVFCGSQLLVSYLRPSNNDAAKHSAAILKLLVQYIRKRWPRTKIVFRGDSGFCRERILCWCDRHGVDYVVGVARNPRLEAMGAELQQQAAERFERSGQKQRLFGEFAYAADSWSIIRWVVHKAEHTSQGANPRFVVTSLWAAPERIYTRYCRRGEMENKIKEQMMLFSDRTSAHAWWSNQWRLLLASLAYVLIDTLRRIALAGTELARATVATIRLKLLKIGCLIERKRSCVVVRMSRACPMREAFIAAASRLRPT